MGEREVLSQWLQRGNAMKDGIYEGGLAMVV